MKTQFLINRGRLVCGRMSRCLLLLTLLLCDLTSSESERHTQGSLTERGLGSLPVGSHEEDSLLLLLNKFPRQTYNITGNVVLTVPVNDQTDMAVVLLLLKQTQRRQFFKSWLTMEARTVSGHVLNLDLNYLSGNDSRLKEPTMTIQLDETEIEHEVTVHFQPSKQVVAVFLDCKELISRELRLSRPSVRRYSAMQLLEVSERVGHRATPTAKICPELEVVCGSLWAQRDRRELSTRQQSKFSSTDTHQSSSLNSGQWGRWTKWSTCSASCGCGIQTRERLCRPPSDIYTKNAVVIDCKGDRLETKICNHKWECPTFPPFLPKLPRPTDVRCNVFSNGLVKPFRWDSISIQPDCGHVLVKDCLLQTFQISAVWEMCGDAICIVSLIVHDSDVGEVLVTKEHHVYHNGSPSDSSTDFLNEKLFVFFDECGVRLVGLKGYEVCYNGSIGNVTVIIHNDLFPNSTCGLCGPNRDDDGQTALAIAGPTPSDLANGATDLQKQTPYFPRNKSYKLPWQCKGCSSWVDTDATRRAQLECGRGLDTSSFRSCLKDAYGTARQLYYRHRNRCQKRMCRCPDSHRRECLCRALSEVATICGKRNAPVTWRNAGFCARPCGSRTTIYKDWGCSITCKDYVNGMRPWNCPLDKYTSGCHCKLRGWVLVGDYLSKSTCVPAPRCPCQVIDELIRHGLSLEHDGSNCTCWSGVLKCGPSKPVILHGDQVLYCHRGSPFAVICQTTNSTRGSNVTLVGPGKVDIGNGTASIRISCLDVSAGSGVYICTAKNAVGSASARIEVKIAVAPVVKSISSAQTIPERSPDVAINCEVVGRPDPKPTVTWTLNGKRLQQDGRRVMMQTFAKKYVWRLKIVELLRNYSGLYSCNASNVAGSSAMSTSVTVVVSDSGILKFLSEPRDVFVEINETARLPCSAIGGPSLYPPRIEWLKDGRPIDVVPRIVLRSFKVIIRQVREGDAGTYECRASSGNNTIRASAFLTIDDGDGWSHWSEWNDCSATCGSEAIMTRHRSCNKPPCNGQRTEIAACSSRPCPGDCYSWGNVHGVTFDGRSYSFRGDCDYILAKECGKNSRKLAFSIRHSMKRCHPSDMDTCSKEVQIFVGDLKAEYILDGNSVTSPTNRRRRKINLPFRSRGISITEDGLFITFRTDNLTVRYDGQNRVYVQVGQRYRNRTCGLCGRFDDVLSSRKNEVKLNGTEHGKKHADVTGGYRCSTLPSQIASCTPELANEAEKYCSALLDDHRFIPCHGAVHPREFYDRCRRSVCECPQELAPSNCSCGTYASYVAMCSQLGIHVRWDDRDSCYVTCASSAQKVFTHCRPAEQLTCPGRSSRNRRRNTRISQCDQSPDLGCYCPEGTALYNDRCIYKTDCPCSNHKDERFPQDPQRLWTDSCSKRNCSDDSLQPPNSCTQDLTVVTTMPQLLSVVAGKTFQLCCIALSRMTANTPSPRYEWFHNGSRIEGESGSSIRQTKAGRYSCRVEGRGPMSKESTVTVYSDPASTCVEKPLDKWILLPRDCQDADSGARRINVGKCSRLPCIDSDDNTRARRCRNTDYCCGVSLWTSVTINCSRSSVSTFTVANASECGCTRCLQQNATLYGDVTWAQTGHRVPYTTIQGLDEVIASDVVDGRYELEVSFNLRYLALKWSPSNQRYYPPLLRVLPFSFAHSIVHHIRLLLPTDVSQVDCRSSTVLTLSSFNNTGSKDFFPLQTSLLIGRDSFRYKNGSICSDSVTVRVTYTSGQTPFLSAESPGVFEYVRDDGSSGLIKPLVVITFSAVSNADKPVDVIRPVRFHIYSPMDNVLSSTAKPLSQGDAITQLQLFLLSESSGLWRSDADGMMINSSDTGPLNNGNYSVVGLIAKAEQAYTVGRRVEVCYARVGAVDVMGNRLGGITVTVKIEYETPYIPTTSKWVTDHNGEKCVPIACHYEAILTATQSWSMQPVGLDPSDRSDDQTDMSYHKNGAIHILSSAPTRPPIYASLHTCQDSSLNSRSFLFVTPELISSFTAVEQEGLVAPVAWRPVLSEPFYFVKVKVIGPRSRQYGVRASTYYVDADGYKLYGWRQERAEPNENNESYVCVEFTFPRKSGATRNNTVVVIDINSNLELGEGRDLCRRQQFSSVLDLSGRNPAVSLHDVRDREFKFIPPVMEFGSSVGIFTDSSRRRAEIDCRISSPERASETRNVAAVVFTCLEEK